MTLTPEQLSFVQDRLDYRFGDVNLLTPCFKAAHRSDRDGVAEDGHRGLAQFGVTVMEMVEKRASCVLEAEPRSMAEQRSQWIKSKTKRAMVCDGLCFTSFVTVSVRQGNDPPSEAARASTVSAIVAAIFEDLCAQKQTLDRVVRTITDVLGRMGTRSLGALPINPADLVRTQTDGSNASIQVAGQDVSSGLSLPKSHSEQPLYLTTAAVNDNVLNMAESAPLSPIGFDMVHCVYSTEVDNEDPAPSIHCADPRPDHALLPLPDRARKEHRDRQLRICENVASPSRSNKQQTALAKQVEEPLRKLIGLESDALTRLSGHTDLSAHQLSCIDDALGRSVDEPYTTSLRYLCHFLGSTSSMVAFKSALCDLRGRIHKSATVLAGARSGADHLRIVENLQGQSAANSLLTMCHLVRLFEDECHSPALSPDHFVVETQATFDGPRRAGVGNPLIMAKAAFTNAKMKALYPRLDPASEEYSEKRKYVARLRRRATKLRLFCHAFGFGILACLPYANVLGGGDHLDRLTEIPHSILSCCIRILKDSQHDYLTLLAARTEPVLAGLINGEFWSTSALRIEYMTDEEILVLPGGSAAFCDYLLMY